MKKALILLFFIAGLPWAYSQNETGLIAEYYKDKTLSQLARREKVSQINFAWGNAGPAGVGEEGFSMRCTGFIKAPSTSNYTFHLFADDGVRLWVNKQLVIDKWQDQSAFLEGTMVLEEGKVYELKLEYYENFWAANCQLSWSNTNSPKTIIPPTAFVNCPPLPVMVETADIEILNLNNAETLDYSLAILRGKCDAINTNIQLESPTGKQSLPVIDGHFKGVVLLKKGENHITLKTEKKTLQWLLNYEPLSNAKQVRMIYALAADDDERFLAPANEPNDINSAKKRLQMAALMMQSATAEMLYKDKNRRISFRLEEDKEGNPAVTLLRLPQSQAELDQKTGNELYDIIAAELIAKNMMDAKNVVVMGFTGYNGEEMTGHTALGGGELGVFGSGTLHTWAQSVSEIQSRFMDERRIDRDKLPDDSAFRGTHWANYATGLGAMLHELGHTFGLPHTDTGIMSRGFDNINRLFCVSEPKNSNVLTIENEGGAIWHPSSSDILLVNDWFLKPHIANIPPIEGYVVGWKAQYANGVDPSLVQATRIDSTINFDWGVGAAIAGVGSDYFSARWTGRIVPAYSEEYTFYLTGDDGIRLWVNGQELINAWHDQGPTLHTGKLWLEKGKFYDVRVDFYENGGGAVCKLFWGSLSQPKSVLDVVYNRK